MKINIKSIIILFIFFELIKLSQCLTFRIKIKFNSQFFQIYDDYILSNYINDIYISLKAGNPHQNLNKIFIKSDSHEFMISNRILDKNGYNNTESYTSKIISSPKYYQLKYSVKGYILKDDLYLYNNQGDDGLLELQNITFIYATKINEENYPSVLGLKLNEEDIIKTKSFPIQLNDLKYIKGATWMIKYNSENEGYYYLGDILNNDIFPNFNKKNYMKTNAIIFGRYLSWDLLFSQIVFNDIKLNGPLQANLDFNFGLISVSKEYYTNIKKEFFLKYLNKGICKELIYNYTDKSNNIKTIKSIFNYIVCENTLKIKNFPQIYFYHTQLDFIFELNYKDIFTTFKNKIYFLCIYELNNNRWIFGKIFFKKYNIIFDHIAKTIGVYSEKNTSKIKSKLLFEWFIVIILFITFVILMYTLIKRYRLNNYKSFEKKIKVNELNEDLNHEYKDLCYFKNENKIIDGYY